MQAEEAVKVYPLFVALTRPAMVFGVTQTFFIFSFMPCMMLFLLSMNVLLAAGLYVLLHAIGFLCCYRDPHLFAILAGKCERVCYNRSYWGCNSYDPG